MFGFSVTATHQPTFSNSFWAIIFLPIPILETFPPSGVQGKHGLKASRRDRAIPGGSHFALQLADRPNHAAERAGALDLSATILWTLTRVS